MVISRRALVFAPQSRTDNFLFLLKHLVLESLGLREHSLKTVGSSSPYDREEKLGSDLNDPYAIF